MNVAAKSTAPSDGEAIMRDYQYGKADVRLVKVVRDEDRHGLRDLNVSITLSGDFGDSYERGDNRGMLSTDTMRNIVYALAKDQLRGSIEQFGLVLARHFLREVPLVSEARVRIVEYPWTRIGTGDRPHPHAFVRDRGERVATVTASGTTVNVVAGIDDLLILKTTESGWAGFMHDHYTTLPETDDRILATIVTAEWSYGDATDLDFDRLWHSIRDTLLTTFTDHYSPSVQHTLFRMGQAVLAAHSPVERIHLSLPNRHHLLFDLARFGLANNNEIFQATTEPYGLIEGTVERGG